MTFLDILLNVLVPILIAGVLSYLISMPQAPFSPGAKRLATWVIWVVMVLWVLVWLLRVLGAFGHGVGPGTRIDGH